MTIRTNARKFLENIVGKLTISNILLTIRQTEGTNQADFAKKLGISRQNLCDIEKNRKSVSPARAAKFAKKLGYPPELFIKISFQDEFKKEGLELKVKSIEVA